MKNLCILTILSVFVLAYGYPTAPENSYPYVSWAVWHSIYNTNCTSNTVEVIELCQRCAIFTKSPIVYPDCCDERDGVRDWCYKADAFGKNNN